MPADPRDPRKDLLAQAKDSRPGLLRELAWFVVENKKWWLIPILVVLLLLGALVLLSSSGLAPFLYTVF
jgi:Family of unknown function (DUF5989)